MSIRLLTKITGMRHRVHILMSDQLLRKITATHRHGHIPTSGQPLKNIDRRLVQLHGRPALLLRDGTPLNDITKTNTLQGHRRLRGNLPKLSLSTLPLQASPKVNILHPLSQVVMLPAQCLWLALVSQSLGPLGLGLAQGVRLLTGTISITCLLEAAIGLAGHLVPRPLSMIPAMFPVNPKSPYCPVPLKGRRIWKGLVLQQYLSSYSHLTPAGTVVGVLYLQVIVIVMIVVVVVAIVVIATLPLHPNETMGIGVEVGGASATMVMTTLRFLTWTTVDECIIRLRRHGTALVRAPLGMVGDIPMIVMMTEAIVLRDVIHVALVTPMVVGLIDLLALIALGMIDLTELTELLALTITQPIQPVS